MGPIVDRSCEHLLLGDAAIIKLRQLLLQALRDYEEGKGIPGSDPRSYRVRSIRCELPRDANMAEMINDLVKADQTSAA